jgi:DNA-binding NtrC family response regulator
MSTRTARLREADQRLFRLVTEAAFANPFGIQRSRLDAEISEVSGDDPAWAPRMLQRVGKRLEALAPHGKLESALYAPEDRDLIEHTVLFETFHRFTEPLDTLIEQQRAQVGASVRVAFADEFLRGLSRRGIDAERARHALELFFQMRRAFYFISRGLVGKSPCMRQLREQLWRAVFTHDLRRYERQLWDRMEDFSTILLGETGTGKGAAAAALGASGFIPFDAAKGAFAYSFLDAFVPIHLNEFPESLFESEIFGHRKGAFTGAVDHYEGALARCKPHGTVFFDEIGEATLPVQVKLLRVLQDRTYSPVGSRELRRFSGRIVAATHRSLDELRAQGAMRDDFFYRLCSNVIELPTLRKRIDEDPRELGELVQHLCGRMAHAQPDGAPLADQVLTVLDRELGPTAPFTGNVRELEQCVRRVLVTGHARLEPSSRAAAQSGAAESALQGALERAELSADALLEQYCQALYVRSGSYVEVARVTGLDRRTVKKHVERARRIRGCP